MKNRKIYALIDNDTYVFDNWDHFHEATFSPELNIQFVCAEYLGNYKKGQELARDKAIDWQSIMMDISSISYGELATWEELFRKLGKRYGLMREFHENCIC